MKSIIISLTKTTYRKAMTDYDRKQLIQILSHFETRSNKDILTLMRISFEYGKWEAGVQTFDEFLAWIKRELLEL